MTHFNRLALAGTALLAALAAGCGGDDDGGTIEPTYENVQMIFRTRACATASCHGGAGAGSANLNFGMTLTSGDFRTELQGMSCEYPPMPLLAPGDAENSWLFIKIDPSRADANRDTQFTPDPSWDGTRPAECEPATGVGRFGHVMPDVPGAQLNAAEVDAVRMWIDMGAPGPAM